MQKQAAQYGALRHPDAEELEYMEEYFDLMYMAAFNARHYGTPWAKAVKQAFAHNNHLAQVQEARHAKRAASRTAHPSTRSHVEKSSK
jgi:hypothetical protein